MAKVEMTKAMAVEKALALVEGSDIQDKALIVECLGKVMADLSRKRKPSEKALKAKAEGRATVLDILGDVGKPLTAAGIVKEGELDIEEYSTQRVAYILSELVKEGVVTSAKEKGKTYYSLVAED